MLNILINQQIGIFGYGVEGQSLVRYLKKHGAEKITVFDEKDINKDDRVHGVEYIIQNFESIGHFKIDYAFRSPGIKIDRLKNLLKGDIKISSATNLFFQISKGKKIIVTGTKGKSTTISMIGKILKDDGRDVYMGGNIGNPLLDFIDNLKDDSFSVVELSSFQLQDFIGKADYYIYLPILIDHLDYHKDFDEYYRAKTKAIVEASQHSTVILPKEEPMQKIARGSKAKIFYYSVSETLPIGCYLEDDHCICHDLGHRAKINNIKYNSEKYKIPIVDMLAAASLSFIMDIQINFDKVLVEFEKPRYRIEEIESSSEITFYNDSASTNPISTIEAMKLMNQPFALILGGSSKNLDYNKLAEKIIDNKFLKTVYLYGETAKYIKKALDKYEYEGSVLYKNNLEQIIEDIVVSGDRYRAVLFSPASASFDQFRNYQDRGDSFENLVKRYFK